MNVRKAARRLIVLGLLAGPVSGSNDAAYAQVTGGPSANATLESASFTATQRYSPEDSRGGQLTVPENISVDPKYRSLLEATLSRSPFFKRQCARIANEPALTVYLNLVPTRIAGGVRGTSDISTTSAGRIVAHVRLHPFDHVEMIAHEFEHIIEYLDAVDLVKKSKRAGSGVRAVDFARSVFETTRARQAGLRVVEEVRNNSGPGT